MTTIELYVNSISFDFKASGHCEHDVCVSVSALTSALIQYAEDSARQNALFRLNVKSYEHGAAEMHIDFGNVLNALNFTKGIEGITTGFRLFEANYPNDVKYIDTYPKSIKYVDAKKGKNSL